MEDVLEFKKKWFRLDNSAKIYPAVLNPKDSCVFRVSANLMQDVEPEVLQRAVTECKPRFPSFYVRLRRGLFWNYYEHNEKDPIVKPESPYINQHINIHANNGYHFTVFHYRNRISLEVFHGLCDAYAALEFLKALTFRYFMLLGYPLQSDGAVLDPDQPPRGIEVEDSFVKNYTPEGNGRTDVQNAYRIMGTRFAGGIGAIHGRMQTEQLAALAKANGATVTQYLAALLTYSIRESDDAAKRSKKPINICIPVNIRKYYSSVTLRNFSLYFHVSTECNNREWSFEAILDNVKKTFKSELTLSKLQQKLNANVAAEKNIALRLCPLFLKNIALKFAVIVLGDKLNTCALSNIGHTMLPPSMARLVKDFDCTLGVGNVATNSVSVVSCNGSTAICFSRSIQETEIERLFFTCLADQGMDIEIQSNLWENH